MMHRSSVLLFLLGALALGGHARAQQRAQWVYFADKGPDAGRLLGEADAAQLGLSRQALERRALTAGIETGNARTADAILSRLRSASMGKAPAGTSAAIGEWDLPVAPRYLSAVTATGAHVRAVSKWLNAVSVLCTDAQSRAISALPFVLRMEPVRRWARREGMPAAKPSSLSSAAADHLHGLEYGSALAQLDVINVPKVHDIWIDGTGIICGMVDDGYRWRPHEAMKNILVLDEYDFINKDTLTENEGDDPYAQDSHGTLTFSTLAGFKEGVLIGPAFNASFYLAKTEVHNSEMPVEEDYWAQGLEWLEAKGAAVVSSSLGYSTFDDSTGYRYENGDFNGRTAVTSRAAARAARLGVVVCTAMGNEGNTTGTLIAPSDADTIISVGAITFENNIASFSSNGPTNDRRTKPDVVAPGVSVFCATKDGAATYTTASGTSLSTPLTSGVAALVRSARPELTPVQVRDALRNTADRAATPDNKYGWGKLDAWKALLANGMVISTNPKILWDGQRNAIAAYVVSPHDVMRMSVSVRYSVDGAERDPLGMTLITPMTGQGSGSGLYLLRLPELPKDAVVRFHVNASDVKETRSSPYGAPAARHEFRVGERRDLGAGNVLPSSFALGQNYPNPFGQNTTTIPYEVPVPGAAVTLELYDIYGRRIATLADGFHAAGRYLLPMNLARGLASGMYLIFPAVGRRLPRAPHAGRQVGEAPPGVASSRLVLLRAVLLVQRPPPARARRDCGGDQHVRVPAHRAGNHAAPSHRPRDAARGGPVAAALHPLRAGAESAAHGKYRAACGHARRRFPQPHDTGRRGGTRRDRAALCRVGRFRGAGLARRARAVPLHGQDLPAQGADRRFAHVRGRGDQHLRRPGARAGGPSRAQSPRGCARHRWRLHIGEESALRRGDGRRAGLRRGGRRLRGKEGHPCQPRPRQQPGLRREQRAGGRVDPERRLPRRYRAGVAVRREESRRAQGRAAAGRRHGVPGAIPLRARHGGRQEDVGGRLPVVRRADDEEQPPHVFHQGAEEQDEHRRHRRRAESRSLLRRAGVHPGQECDRDLLRPEAGRLVVCGRADAEGPVRCGLHRAGGLSDTAVGDGRPAHGADDAREGRETAARRLQPRNRSSETEKRARSLAAVRGGAVPERGDAGLL
ncbi:MAG: S8 family peptidase [Ignavibacteria bacterium]|nr:S8 family peptidase [Ignavibacteria bacterium]